jgi:hypothetical protein
MENQNNSKAMLVIRIPVPAVLLIRSKMAGFCFVSNIKNRGKDQARLLIPIVGSHSMSHGDMCAMSSKNINAGTEIIIASARLSRIQAFGITQQSIGNNVIILPGISNVFRLDI